jgi:hypothetical protein
MTRMRYLTMALVLVACSDDGGSGDGDGTTDGTGGTGGTGGGPRDVAEFGSSPTVAITGTAADGLDVPRDLEFHPDHPDQLWVVNQATDGMVIYFDPGSEGQTSEARVDFYAVHFMEEVSSIAFGAPDDTVEPDRTISTFGTCQESRNTYNDTNAPNDFMGPALWPGDLDLFAEVHQFGLGSHIDMLHQSPMCVGMAHIRNNEYWVFDGNNDRLTWYDFQIPHGYGEDDHSDGLVRRYEDVVLKRVPDVPGHIDLGADGFVYVADTGTGRLLKIDPSTAEMTDELSNFFEPLDEFTEWQGATVVELVTGLDEPSGVAVGDGVVFVSDHGSGDIIAFDTDSGAELGRVQVAPGVMGLELGPDGQLWFANGGTDEVGHIVAGG